MRKHRKLRSALLRTSVALAVLGSIPLSSFLTANAALAAHAHRTGWHSHKIHYTARTEDDPLYMDYRHDARTEDDPLYMEDYQPPEDFYRASPSGWDSGYEESPYPPWDDPYNPRWAPGVRQPNSMPY